MPCSLQGIFLCLLWYLFFSEDKPDQTGSVEYKDRGIHKQMGEQCADDHAIWSQQKTDVEAKPADKAGIAAHQDQQVEIFQQFWDGTYKIFCRKIKVDESADRQRNKIQEYFSLKVMIMPKVL